MSIQPTHSYIYTGFPLNCKNLFSKTPCSPKIMASFMRDADILSMTKEDANEMDPNEFWKAIFLWLQPSETWTHFHVLGAGSITREQLQWCLQHEVPMGPLRLVKWNESMERDHLWETPDWEGETLAIITGRLDKVDLNHPQINSILCGSDHYFGATLLQVATALGHYEICDDLLAAGADVNRVGNRCKTPPLKLAFNNGDLQLISLLLDKGADISGADHQRWFPLMDAAMNNDLEIVKLLLMKNSNVNQADAHGNTTLMHASAYGHAEIVNALLAKDADINVQNKDGNSALIIAVCRNNIEVFNILVDRVKDINQKNNHHTTALSVAAANGNTGMVKTLLSKGADPDIEDINKVTPLLRAVDHVHKDVFHLLIDNVKDLNHRNKFGKTVLHYACRTGNDIDMVKKLLEKGADISVITENDPEPDPQKRKISSLHSAALWGRFPLVDLLLKWGAEKVSKIEEATVLLKGLTTNQPRLSKRYYRMLSKIPLDEKVINPVRQELQIQSLAHLFKIERPFPLLPILNKQNVKFDFMGNVDSPYWLGKILRSNELMRKRYPDMSTHIDLIKETFSHALDHLDGRNETILERIQEDKPTVLLTGFNTHGVTVVISGNFFVLSETSGITKKPFQIFFYNPKKLDLSVLNMILLETRFGGEEAYKDIFWEKLPHLLDFVENEPNTFLYHVEEKSPIEYQTCGNCTYAGVEGAVWALFILNAINSKFKSDCDLEYWNSIIQTEIKRFGIWKNFSEAYHLERYLGARILRQPKEKIMERVYKLDSNLIESAFTNAHPLVDPGLTPIFEQLKNTFKSTSDSNPDLFFQSSQIPTFSRL